MALNETSSPCHQGMTPPDSPTKGPATSQTIVKDLKHLFDVFLEKDQSPAAPDIIRLKQLLVKFTSDEFASVGPFAAADEIDLNRSICTTPDNFKSFEKWASASQFKTVVETWDKEACKYKIAEPTETSISLDDYAEYIFIVRKRVNRTSEEVVLFIDIKSEGLRDILQNVLHDIKAVSLIEDKLSIEQNFLFHFLLELDRCAENIDSSSDYKSALFKPSCYIYTIYISTNEPRYIVFDMGEEITRNDETWLNLECRFLDYNGVKFGEAGIFLRVAKFRGLKPIESLEAFPLCHYLSYDAFFINKRKAFKVNINSRVAVDVAFFYKMQPNYSRPSLRDIRVKDKDRIAVINISAMLIEDYKREKERI
ncbi:unnamed protein product [Penicillium camemberti]|uniref:Str. FM013 n=1 Tax=Penicillium camemberti (strain FM 013) TaxID=1429867 RepID=A0A0G4PMJ4_PENC3|nr:unnamed protein product [Penicillium camemberti]